MDMSGILGPTNCGMIFDPQEGVAFLLCKFAVEIANSPMGVKVSYSHSISHSNWVSVIKSPCALNHPVE